MPLPSRGQVWLIDLGLVAKIRPALVLSVPFSDADGSLITLVPHTTSVRGSAFEAAVAVRFLKAGAFDAQGIVTVPPPRFMRFLGTLTPSELASVESVVVRWLGLPPTAS